MLLLWTCCYLSCSFERLGDCPHDSSHFSSEVDSCPSDGPGNDEAPACTDAQFSFTMDGNDFAVEAPESFADAAAEFAARILARTSAPEESTGDFLADFNVGPPHSETDLSRQARPIRGPAV